MVVGHTIPVTFNVVNVYKSLTLEFLVTKAYFLGDR